MKYLLITGIFALGLAVGYVVGTQTAAVRPGTGYVAELPEDKVIPEDKVEETGFEKPAAETNRELLTVESDSLTETEIDTSETAFVAGDSLFAEDDLSISREKLLKSVHLTISVLSAEEEKDTVIKDLLGIEEVQPKSIMVEFWESPLNFEGYKLSRKKLIVYGMNPQPDYKIYRRNETYYFAYQNVFYKMKETQDFLPFSEVSKSEVFHD